MPNTRNFEQKICIVGAGAAGLSAAYFLRQKGYKNITLIEKEDSAGGKCCSVQYKNRSYELGAVLGDFGYRTTLSIIKQTGTQKGKPPSGYLSDLNGNVHDLQERCRKPSLVWEVLRSYMPVRIADRRIEKPGFDNFNSQFHDNFGVWARHKNILQAYNAFEPSYTGFGYGYFEDIPAAYVVKFFNLTVMLSGPFFTRTVFVWQDGIQEMWKQIAKGFDIHYSTDIKRIIRGNTGKLEADNATHEFDTLLLACPLDASLTFLDASSREKDLFSKINHIDYQVYLCFIDDLPEEHRHDYIMPNIQNRAAGEMIVWYKRWADSDLVAVYVISDWEKSYEQIVDAITANLKQLGATLRKVHTFKKWKYFPHVKTEDFKNRYYENLEEMQGKNNTYYAGELLSFPSVEHVTSYSKDLVKRFF